MTDNPANIRSPRTPKNIPWHIEAEAIPGHLGQAKEVSVELQAAFMIALYGLHNELPEDGRATHLNGGEYDRILVSPSLTTDYDYKDLVFDSVERRKDLVVRQEPDAAHADGYWDIPEAERDLSDHYPLVATFKFVNCPTSAVAWLS